MVEVILVPSMAYDTCTSVPYTGWPTQLYYLATFTFFLYWHTSSH